MEVGNTPVIKLSDKLYGKLESVNPGGSIKDRPVKYILDRMDLKQGDTIVEATSGKYRNLISDDVCRTRVELYNCYAV